VKDAQEERDAEHDACLAKRDECLSRLAQRDEWASDCAHLQHHLVEIERARRAKGRRGRREREKREERE
jgi:hypothetical protein